MHYSKRSTKHSGQVTGTSNKSNSQECAVAMQRISHNFPRCCSTTFLGCYLLHTGSWKTTNYSFNGFFKILHLNRAGISTCSKNCRLVANICNVCTHEAGRKTCKSLGNFFCRHLLSKYLGIGLGPDKSMIPRKVRSRQFWG